MRPLSSPSTVSLLARDAVLAAGVLFLDWDVTAAIFLFWLEGLVLYACVVAIMSVPRDAPGEGVPRLVRMAAASAKAFAFSAVVFGMVFLTTCVWGLTMVAALRNAETTIHPLEVAAGILELARTDRGLALAMATLLASYAFEIVGRIRSLPRPEGSTLVMYVGGALLAAAWEPFLMRGAKLWLFLWLMGLVFVVTREFPELGPGALAGVLLLKLAYDYFELREQGRGFWKVRATRG